MNMVLQLPTNSCFINCPYCGERDQAEFTCGGEAHIARPKNPPD